MPADNAVAIKGMSNELVGLVADHHRHCGISYLNSRGNDCAKPSPSAGRHRRALYLASLTDFRVGGRYTLVANNNSTRQI